MLAFTLTAFLELMDHGIVSWDLISLSFIKQVVPQTTDLEICRFVQWAFCEINMLDEMLFCFLIPFYSFAFI